MCSREFSLLFFNISGSCNYRGIEAPRKLHRNASASDNINSLASQCTPANRGFSLSFINERIKKVVFKLFYG